MIKVKKVTEKDTQFEPCIFIPLKKGKVRKHLG